MSKRRPHAARSGGSGVKRRANTRLLRATSPLRRFRRFAGQFGRTRIYSIPLDVSAAPTAVPAASSLSL